MLNECNFIGRLGKDVESRFMPNGKAVANFTLAVGEKYKDKNTGEMVETTEWVRCAAFDRQAEIAAEYLRKGSLIHVKGRMKTRKYTDGQGVEKYSTEIMVDRFVMLGPKSDNQGQSQGQQAAPQQQANVGVQPNVTKVENNFDNFDDDIPF